MGVASNGDPVTALSLGLRPGLSELVQAHLPGLTRRIIGEEVERLRAEAFSVPVEPALLAEALRQAFEPLVERTARETARIMLRDILPEMAERLVREEIARIGQSD
ncbi:hypothetical protein SIID45300_01803 [Candidatus Magnetaquicoccaceae bacterium FCR-1]|uniref:Uncharacterized protein n=1 Tax=Candidatus Magnetaquiglobus chichijimensis TaxID=3141448 RepID=A0ABQ0C9C6_9PROT